MVKEVNDKILSSNSSVFFATFAPYENNKRLATNGMVEPMLSFLLPKLKRTLVVIQPHPGSDIVTPLIEIYQKKILKEERSIPPIYYFPLYLVCKLRNTSKTHVSFKLRDLFSVLFIGLKQKEPYDYFIGLEAINTLGGIILRRFGKVKKTIYYVSDYSPQRYGKTLFNFLYLWLDRFCATKADYIWDVSTAMQPARIKAGLNVKKSAPVIHVPNALFPSQISCLPVSKRLPYSLVYMGTLGFENGPDLAIESLAEVKNKFPEAKLHIVGGGIKNISRLKELVEKLNLGNSVIFYGFVEDNNKMAEIVRKCYIALAPYRAIEKSVRWYADATKIRQYLASGLPVITTKVPPLGRQIVEKGAGILAEDNKNDFAKAIIKLFSDRKLYFKLEEKAKELSRLNTWENTYKNTFYSMTKN